MSKCVGCHDPEIVAMNELVGGEGDTVSATYRCRTCGRCNTAETPFSAIPTKQQSNQRAQKGRPDDT